METSTTNMVAALSALAFASAFLAWHKPSLWSYLAAAVLNAGAVIVLASTFAIW